MTGPIYEPLAEASETAWAGYLDRFDQQIYPVLFKSRGYTRGEALQIWGITAIEEEIIRLRLEMVEFREEMRA